MSDSATFKQTTVDQFEQLGKRGGEKLTLSQASASVSLHAQVQGSGFASEFLVGVLGRDPSEQDHEQEIDQLAGWLNQGNGGFAAEVFGGDEELPEVDRPFDARGAELIEIATAAAARKADVPASWLAWLQHAVAPTLARLEEECVDPEEQVDLLAVALGSRKGRLGAHAAELLLSAERLLLTQSRRDAGYYKTHGTLADLLGDQRDPASRATAAAIYGRVIDAMRQRWHEYQPDWFDPLIADANNRASTLAELQQDDEALASIRLSIVAGLAQDAEAASGRARPEPDAAAAHELAAVLFFDRAAPLPDAWLAALARMANIPTAWRGWADEVYSAGGAASQPLPGHFPLWLTASAAPARLLLGHDIKDVTGALFNTAVALLRVSGQRSESASLARVGLNAAALRLALAGSEGVYAALVRDNGLDCAVNLLGALAGLPQDRHSALAPTLSRFAALLWSMPDLVRAQSGDYLRMRNSLEKVGIGPGDYQAAGEPSRTLQRDLCAALDALVAALLRVADQSAPPAEQWQRLSEGDAIALARWCRWCVETGLGDHELVSRLSAGLHQEITRLVARSGQLDLMVDNKHPSPPSRRTTRNGNRRPPPVPPAPATGSAGDINASLALVAALRDYVKRVIARGAR